MDQDENRQIRKIDQEKKKTKIRRIDQSKKVDQEITGCGSQVYGIQRRRRKN